MQHVKAGHTAFLRSHDRAHLSTIGPDGTPQVKPLGYTWNEHLQTLDISGFDIEHSAKYRNVAERPRVAVVVDDGDGAGDGALANRFLEVRGIASQVRHPEPLVRIHPTRIISWNIAPPGELVSYDIEGPHLPPPPTRAIEDFIATIQEGFDRRDADRYDSWMAADVLWGSPYGATLASLGELNAVHRRIHADPVVGRSAYEAVAVRSPAPGVALAQVRRNTLDGDFPSEMALYVLVERSGRWELAAGHNTIIQTPPARR